jgi:alkanesulfonate monooxygenase SsuD/methylene tetrahydromethanopterin reductase-like flavin-dependent oxidoreductase (luciferase family)
MMNPAMGLNLTIGATSWKSNTGWSADAICGQAEVAESMGFHSFWLPEHHFGDHRAMPSPLTLLAAVAARTRSIKLGTVSYLLPIRHPLLAAEEVAVLDQLSNGRVILGVGRGIQGSMFKAFELPRKDKRRRFGKNLAIMQRAWSGEAITTDESGKPVFLAPLPVQKPYPPIWVAAFGPLALKQVGEFGLPYLASPIETLTMLEENYARFHRIVRDSKLEAVTTVPVMRTVFVTEDSHLAGRLKSSLAQFSPSVARDAPVGVDDWTIIGDRHYVRDRLGEYVERLGVTCLIASGRLPGLEGDAVLRSHQNLLECVG